MIDLIKRFFKIRIIRYGMVGGIGIPIQNLALLLFTLLMGPRLFPVENACAFIISNFINFVLNQFFTYREQVQGIHGWEWAKRFFKGQLTSLSATLIAYLVALVLFYTLSVNRYISSDIGIVIAFLYNFFISNKLVFRPTTPATSTSTAQSVQPATNVDVMQIVKEQEAEATPK